MYAGDFTGRMAFSWKLGNGVSYKYTIPLSLENRLAAFKECAKLGLAICVRSLLFFNFLVGGKFKHVEKNAHHLLSKKSTWELILEEVS